MIVLKTKNSQNVVFHSKEKVKITVDDKMFCVCVGGEVRFASYYGDHMVLQKSPEKAVVWGYGPEGSLITVYLSGPIQQKSPAVTVTKGEYSWLLMLTSTTESSRPGHI